jgi:hypothetical protein
MESEPLLKRYGTFVTLTANEGPVRIFIIYLSRVLCLSVCVCVCVSQFVAERSAILLVLVIKLTQEARQRD